ncbi:unnamed protein product [Arabis nemorensis]|uniref:Uncharacterized protein n=1 Tax=Arabis nemorensis TaxID=586526 RepID=A0A565BP97_9BRAS|nr:unnamed protein product [Arabis nemorensis]
MKKDFGLDINYWNMWQAREVAREVVRESIRPGEELLDLGTDTIGQCLPPDARRSPGRPKKRRYQGIEETIMKRPRKQHACSRCHHSGHNRATCDFVGVVM